MNDTSLQIALRRLRRHGSHKRAWLVLLVVALTVGAVGPFGTYGQLSLPVRLVYWLVVVIGTYGMGFLFSEAIAGQIGDRLPPLGRDAIAGALAGVPIALAVIALNALVFGSGDGLGWSLLVYTPLISAVVSTLLGMLMKDRQQNAHTTVPEPPPILKRLPLPQRGRLISLSVSDHYVDIVTERGSTLVLMRLGDAIAETRGVAGLQVHRSHWVAIEAVRRIVRRQGKMLLELDNGVTVPVSRSYQNAAREAGLIG